jgi:hypothetical protein
MTLSAPKAPPAPAPAPAADPQASADTSPATASYVRIMLDSEDLAAIPSGIAPLVASYADLFPTLAALHEFEQAHPASEVVLIDRALGDPLGLASVADVESGALSPGQLPGWFDKKTAANVRYLTVYCDRADLAACDAALGDRDHWRWVATLDGTAFLDLHGYPPLRRPAAIQCLGSNDVGIDCDLSLVLNPNWHRPA